MVRHRLVVPVHASSDGTALFHASRVWKAVHAKVVVFISARVLARVQLCSLSRRTADFGIIAQHDACRKKCYLQVKNLKAGRLTVVGSPATSEDGEVTRLMEDGGLEMQSSGSFGRLDGALDRTASASPELTGHESDGKVRASRFAPGIVASLRRARSTDSKHSMDSPRHL